MVLFLVVAAAPDKLNNISTTSTTSTTTETTDDSLQNITSVPQFLNITVQSIDRFINSIKYTPMTIFAGLYVKVEDIESEDAAESVLGHTNLQPMALQKTKTQDSVIHALSYEPSLAANNYTFDLDSNDRLTYELMENDYHFNETEFENVDSKINDGIH